jgi:hypothetical protein
MNKNIFRGAGLLGLALLSVSCIFLGDDPWGGLSGGSTVQEFLRTVPLAPKSGLSVLHLDGDIEIRGWDRNEAEIAVESDRWVGRRGVFGGRVGRPRIDVQTGPDGALTVRTIWEGDERNVYPVHYYISVPRSIDLRDIRTGRGSILIADLYGRAGLQIQSGDLKIENYSGSLKAQVWRGRIEAEILDLRPEDDVQLTARDGDVTVWLEAGAGVRIEAEASGGVSSEFDLRQKLPTGKVTAAIGSGGAPLALKALNGRIALKIAH